jgi:multiple sugar transport system substrate-binding protein
MKKLLSTLLAVTLLASMTACGASNTTGESTAETGSEEASTGTSEGATLEVWARQGYSELMTDAAASFSEETGIQVNVTQPSDMSDDLALALSAGTAPDIVSIDCVLIPYYASIGALKDVTEQFNSLEFVDQFSGGLLDLANYDGKQYGVPFSPDLSVLLYNKDMFEAAGLDPESPPTTWDELIEAAKATTTDDCYGYVFSGGDAGGMMFTFGPYLWNNGGDFTKNDGKESSLDTPEVQEAVQLLVDMVYEYKVTPESITSYDWTSTSDAFKAGKAAMIVLGSSAVGDIVNGEYNFEAGCGLIPSPDGKTYSSFSGGDSIAMLESTEYPDEAWQFIEYCLSPEVQVDQLAASGYIPARLDLYDNELYAGHEEYQVLMEALKVGRAPYSVKYNEMYTPWLDALQYALNKEKTVETALADAKTEIDAILSE